MSYSDSSGVFFNKLGITDGKTLAAAEYQSTALKAAAWPLRECKTPFGLERLKETHHFLFEEVYEWAGKERTVTSSKRHPDGRGVSKFEEPNAIKPSWNALEQTIARCQKNTVTHNEKVNELTAIFIEANRIHPFPEGNGRSLQLFMKDFAATQGVELDFSKVDKGSWNDACAVSTDYKKLYERGLVKVDAPGDTKPIYKVFNDIATMKEVTMPVLDPLSPTFEKELVEQNIIYDDVLSAREAFKQNYLKVLDANYAQHKAGAIPEAKHAENVELMISNGRLFDAKLDGIVDKELQDKFARDEERRRLQSLPSEAVEAPAKASAVDIAVNALAPEATPLLKRDEYILPRSITQAYNTHEGKFFDKAKPERLVFQDDGVKLATATDDKKAIADMVTLAKSKNWGELKLSGSQEFRREAWLQAESQGIKTAGYTPKEADLAQLKSLQQERSKNTITPVGERQREAAAVATAAAPAQRHDMNKNQAALALAGEANKTANMATLKEKPAFQGISAKELEAVAFWRGIVMEENKDQPKPIQTTRLAEFDGKMEDSKNRAALPDPALASIESDVKVHAKEAKEHKTPEHDLSL